MKRYCLIILIPIVLYIAFSSPSTTSNNFLTDPENDDDGNGSLQYPTNPVFVKGAFDLTGFSVNVDDSYIVFKVYLRNLGDNPWNGTNGFSLQYIHIYVLTTDNSLPWSYETYGLNIYIWHGWNYAILVCGGWGNTSLPSGELSAIYSGDGSLVAVQNQNTYRISANSTENSITIAVSRSLLRDTENYMKWIYVVALASYDGYSSSKVRPIRSGNPSEWEFGGGDQEALNATVYPYVIDLLAPGDTQYRMLSSYDASSHRLAVVGGVDLYGNFYPPGSVIKTITSTFITTASTSTTTLTTTETIANTTITNYETKTTTFTTTETSIVRETTTIPTTVSEKYTETTTVKEPLTKTITSTETTTSTTTTTTTKTVETQSNSMIIAIALTIAGVILAIYLLKKPRS